MEYASAPRKTTAKKNTKTKKEKVKARDIKILPIDKSRSFSEEIPEQLKYRNYLSKLMFWSKTSRDRWSWDKIPKDAKNLDKEIVERKAGHPLVFTNKADKVAEKLKKDSIEYIDKNKSYIGDELEYDGKDETKAIISKRSLVARKMVNKVVNEVKYGGSFNVKDINKKVQKIDLPLQVEEKVQKIDLPVKGINKKVQKIDLPLQVEEKVQETTNPPVQEEQKHGKQHIKEGAKNVNLKYGIEWLNGNPKNKRVIKSDSLKYLDCSGREVFTHDPEAKDCLQMRLGDCWLQAALIAILTQKGSQPIKKMFKDRGDHVIVRLYYPKDRTGDKVDVIDRSKWRWVPKYYSVPKKIPLKKRNEPMYNMGPNYWVHYLQAAVAKSGIRDKAWGDDRTLKDTATGQKTRDYASVVGGDPDIAWRMIFGGSIKTKVLKSDKFVIKKSTDKGALEKVNKFYDTVKKELDEGKLMTISFSKASLKYKDSDVGISGGEHKDRGLATNHSYAVIGAEEHDGVKYIRLINPWCDRIGRKYIDYTKGKKGDKGKKRLHSYLGEGDESFLLKATTACRHLKQLFMGDV